MRRMVNLLLLVALGSISMMIAACGGGSSGGTGGDTSNQTSSQLPAPTGVTGTAGNTLVTISWDVVPGAQSYNIYWSTTAGVTANSGTKIAGVTSPYTHSGLTGGTAYHYVVTAVNGAGESAPSAEVTAPPQAAAETVVYSQDFETSNGSYTTDGNAAWTWGTPTRGPSAARSGQKCWGTHPAANPVATVEGNLYSPQITIPALSAGQIARVSFYAYLDVNYEQYGEGDFYISTDGKQTWQLLDRFYEKMTGGWQRYVYNVSAYAGKTLNLRFRAYMQNTDAGMFIDDVAVRVETVVGSPKLLTLEASEDTDPKASCPWVFTWDGTGFVRDNDIYSVARYPQGEMRDFYLLQKPLVAENGVYKLEIREVESEDSWTDFMGLRAVDHDPGVAVAPDGKGNIFAYRPAQLTQPVTAVSNAGFNALPEVRNLDGSGFKAYSGDSIDVDFGNVDVSTGAVAVLRIRGFNQGTGKKNHSSVPPPSWSRSVTATGRGRR